MICGKSWGSLDRGWTFCTLQRAHEGTCINLVCGPKQPDEVYFEDDTTTQMVIEKQLEEDRKRQAKKHAQ